MDLNEVRAKRLNCTTEARAILDAAAEAKRALSAEEETRFDALMAEADRHEQTIAREERVAAVERDLATSQGRTTTSEQPGTGAGAGAGERTNPRASEEYRAAFRRFLVSGINSLSGTEVRALQADNPAEGGFLVAPQQFITDLLANVKDAVFIRQLATVMQLDRSESLGVPVLDTDLNDADWTSELATGNEDTALRFGKRELKPNPLAKRAKISKKLLRQNTIDVEAIVRDRLSYKFAVTEEKAFLTGTGAGQPLGVFTANAMGVSTGRDTVAAAAAAFDGNDFINVKHDLKPQYWDKARWVFHRDVLKAVRKLKDTTGNYLWAPGLGPGGGLTGGNPPTICEIPYSISEYAPNTIATGQYTALLADFSYYWIVDALDLEVQVLDQLYAETNQNGYIARKETDGMPVLEEAFRRLKMA